MSNDKSKRLGRGLEALLARTPTRQEPATGASSEPRATNAEAAPESPLRNLPVSQIRPNPLQPRKEFKPEELADLEASLRVSGLLQPITVRHASRGGGYEL